MGGGLLSPGFLPFPGWPLSHFCVSSSICVCDTASPGSQHLCPSLSVSVSDGLCPALSLFSWTFCHPASLGLFSTAPPALPCISPCPTPDRPLCPCPHSDQMGNKASYIHLRGSDLRPQFHQFTAVVSHAHGPLFSGLGLGSTRLRGLVKGRARCPTALAGRAALCIWWSETPSEAASFLSPLSSRSPASSRRQAHGLRQHAAAVRDDVRRRVPGPAPHVTPGPAQGNIGPPFTL